MRRLVLALVLGVVVGSCGDESSAPSGVDGTADDDGDDGDLDNAPATLTEFAIDQITNRTADDTLPAAYAEFESLPDPAGDANDATVFSILF